jgi:glycosyltransferase involved in cell wall biosynthesis
LVSVVLPVYNSRRYLAAAIESVRAQTMSDFELILVDDGSTDGSAKVMDAAANGDARLRVIRRPNTGLVGALNDGLAAVRGQFVARMDADDLCVAERFAKQLRYLEENPRCVAVGAAVDLIDPAGRRLKTMHAPRDHAEIVKELLGGNGAALVHPAVMYRAGALPAVGGYSLAFAGYGEDWDLFLRLSLHGSLANLGDVLLQYRMHPHSYNHTRRADQVHDYLAAVNRARALNSLAPMTALIGPRPTTRAEVHRLWAEWAIEGAEYQTARSHSLQALVRTPFKRSSWQFLKYSAGLAAQPAPPGQTRAEVSAKH